MANDTSKQYYDEITSYGVDISIIYAEDDVDTRDAMAKILQRIFKDIRVATDGVEALALYKKRRADIVVTDIVMPNMDAFDLCKNIKAINKDQKIIVISGHGDQDRLAELIDIGVDKFIRKPVEDELLLQKLSAISQGIFDHKQNIELHKQLEEKLASIQKIINLMSDGVVVVRGEQIVHVNQSFLSFTDTNSADEYLKKNKKISDLFYPTTKEYLQPEITNAELIKRCIDKGLQKFILKKDNDIKVIQIKLATLSQSSYILTCTDITHFEKELTYIKKQLLYNPITKIFNKHAILDKLKDLQNTQDISIVLYSFSNYSFVKKNHGREAVLNAERYFAEIAKDIINVKFKSSDIFFANYDKNIFLFICKKIDAHSLCNTLFEREIIISITNTKTNQLQPVRLNSTVKNVEQSSTNLLEDIEREVKLLS